jgi:hypothetical protein
MNNGKIPGTRPETPSAQPPGQQRAGNARTLIPASNMKTKPAWRYTASGLQWQPALARKTPCCLGQTSRKFLPAKGKGHCR